MGQTLFEISADMQALDELLAECDGQIDSPEVEAILCKWADDVTQNFEDKVDNYAALIKTMQARAEIRKAEADRLRARAKVDENTANSLRQRLQMVFENRGMKKIETARFQIGIAKNGGLQPMDVDETRIAYFPESCKKIIISPDKEAIRKALESGEEVPGCALRERGTSLRIR